MYGTHARDLVYRNRINEDGEGYQQTHYFHCDQIGILREVTDDKVNLVWFGEYYGWGKLKNETNISAIAHQPFRLQKQNADCKSGLHYNFFRYYESDVGQLVNQDLIGLKSGENLYWFAPNVQRWIDPLGLWGALLARVIPVVVGAISKLASKL